MKIAILGAGAMGSLIGAFLKKSGEEVLLIDPWQEHMEKIKREGLKLHLNDTVETVFMETTTTPEGQTPADMMVVLVKGIATREALQGASELYDKHTYVLTLQNGLGNAEILEEFIDRDHILKGVMKIASHLEGAGAVASRTMKNVTAVYLGCMENTPESVQIAKKLEADFNAAEVKAEFEEEIDYYIWSKAVNNIAINAACGIARMNIRNFLGTPCGWEILEQTVEETVKVANAKGISLHKEAVLQTIRENTIPKIGEHLPSTAQDMKAGKLTEVDFLNGAVSDYGRELGIATPVNDIIRNFVKVMETNYENQF